jgi:hypothetical protein
MQLPLPSPTRYDQAARYLLLRAGALLFWWLLRLTPAQVRFERWLPTQLTLPGVPQRLCDAVAELADLERGGRPFAALLEVQTQPDATMPGRLMLAGGLVWLTAKPTTLPGDRYELLGLVINLTGVGDATRRCVLGTAEWTLRPVELNLETLDAGAVLEEIAGGSAPRELLAFIPLMQRGDEEGIIRRWRELVGAETDLRRRGDYSLALVFAERVNRGTVWQNALEGFSMIESPLIAELLAQAEAKAEARAQVKTLVETLLRALRKRFGELPEEMTASLSACGDSDQLGRWLDAALDAPTLAAFRQQTGL